MAKRRMHERVFYASLIFLCLVSQCFADSEPLVLFPFTIHAENNMDFLKQGTSDLIDNRLSGKGLRVVRAETAMEKSQAVKHTTDASAKTLIMGSLTFLGNTISINANYVDALTGKTLVSYLKADSDKDHLFAHINDFTDQVVLEAQKSVAPRPPAPVVTPAPVAGEPLPAALLSAGIKRSQNIKGEIYALTTGDVDGDGHKEIIFAERHGFSIAGFKDKTLEIKKRVEGESFLDNLYVETFDANKNGIDEIFVTAVQIRSYKVSSSVYEWNGKEFGLIQSELNYFIRAGKDPETGKPALLCQEQQMMQGVFAESIMEMGWSAGRKIYAPLKKLNVPEKTLFIYGMDSGDLQNNGVICSAAYLPSDHLAVFDFKRENNWKSTTRYGGLSKYIEPLNSDLKERFYFPARILTGDFDKNGTQEFTTLVNTNSVPRMFSNLRNFTEGHVECLGWKSLSYETLWKTQTISGYIPDFSINDLDGDGKNELVYAVVTRGSILLGNHSSYVVVQPITP